LLQSGYRTLTPEQTSHETMEQIIPRNRRQRVGAVAQRASIGAASLSEPLTIAKSATLQCSSKLQRGTQSWPIRKPKASTGFTSRRKEIVKLMPPCRNWKVQVLFGLP
jgi:hypothetical protein